MPTVHSPAGRFVALSDMGILVDDRVAPEAAAEERWNSRTALIASIFRSI